MYIRTISTKGLWDTKKTVIMTPTFNLKCFYCGRFMGSKDDIEVETIYGHMSPDYTAVYHKSCKK